MIDEEEKMKQNFAAKQGMHVHTHTHTHMASHASSPAQPEFCQ